MALALDHHQVDIRDSGSQGKIAYTRSPETEGYEICSMNPDGTNQVDLTQDDTFASDWNPTWSPDGGKIAFVNNRVAENGGVWEIFTMNPDGSNQVRLTNDNDYIRAPIYSPKP
jgi:Tol biopolymer transport system component